MTRIFLMLCVGTLLCGAASAETTDPLLAETSAAPAASDSEFLNPSDDAFAVVETSDGDIAAGLNRIAGDVNLGFSSPGDSYESSSHGRLGPWASYSGDRGSDY